MVDRVRQQLGNYRLVRLLGRGGFANVYLGEHVHLNTQHAIKVLHTRLSREDIEKFRDEARLLARMDHPHILKVQDFGLEHGLPYLVMDYAPNGSLRQCHKNGEQLTLAAILPYIKQVAKGLQYAHNQQPPIIHRDIKPENLLLGRNNEVLLADFGIAIAATYVHPHSPIGTAAYRPQRCFAASHIAPATSTHWRL